MGKRGICIQGVEPSAFLTNLAASRSGLSFLYAERIRAEGRGLFDALPPLEEDDDQLRIRIRPGDLETDLAPLELQKRLSTLSKRCREWQEEQGLNVLFIAIGFLKWIDENQEEACSPILLIPCELKRESPRDAYRLVADETDDPVINSTLRYKLASTASISLPEYGVNSIEEYLASIGHLIANKDGMSIDASIVLANFPFSKLSMWQDLELIKTSGVSHSLVRRLAGDMDTVLSNPDHTLKAIPVNDDELQGAKLDDLINLHDQHTVLDADFSQLRAIELARSGVNLVIHGPPGTGKSQTIANIIATLLAEGRSLLFVSEKTAALDVVKRRLEEVGLGAACLDLHSDRGKKSSVYSQLREALKQPPARPHEYPYEQLIACRDKMNSIVRDLHRMHRPLGLSVFDVHGKVAAIGAMPHINYEINDISTYNSSRVHLIQDVVSRIAERRGEFKDHNTSRWRVLGNVRPSPNLADIIRNDLKNIRTAIESTVEKANVAATVSGISVPKSLAEVNQLIRVLKHLQFATHAIPEQWLNPAGFATAVDSIDLFRKDVELRNRLLESIHVSIKGSPPGSQSKEWHELVCTIAGDAPRWNKIAGQYWSDIIVADARYIEERWGKYATLLDEYNIASNKIQKLLSYDDLRDTKSAADIAMGLAQRLIDVGAIPKAWSSIEAIDMIRAEIVAASRYQNEMLQYENELSILYGIEIIDRVDEDMLVRYRTDYRAVWRRLRSNFRRDHRIIRGCMKCAGKLSIEEATHVIELAITIRKMRARWITLSARLRHLLEERFAEYETNWAAISSALDAVATIYKDYPAKDAEIYSVLVDHNLYKQVAEAANEVQNISSVLDTLCPEDIEYYNLPDMSSDARMFIEAANIVGSIVEGCGVFIKRPKSVDELRVLLHQCKNLYAIEVKNESESKHIMQELGSKYTGWSTDCINLENMLEWTSDLLSLLHQNVPRGLIELLAHDDNKPKCKLEEDNLAKYVALLKVALVNASPRFPEELNPWESWVSVSFVSILNWCNDLYECAEEANNWIEYRNSINELNTLFGGNISEAIRESTDNGDLVPGIVLRHVYMSWLAQKYYNNQNLQFPPSDLDRVISQFRTLDTQIPQIAREHVRDKCLARLSNLSTHHKLGEYGVLTHQLSLRRSQMPVRKLVAKIPNLLQIIKPCFMMSPLAVSQYLPRGIAEHDTLKFDTIIFDEASQVFPEDAIPAIARGNQAIIVGDRQQLPPTNYWRSKESDDIYDEDDGYEDDSNRLRGVESILDVMVGMHGAGVADVDLKVHYRSRHDALIRYSNHYFYDDRLLTFPSAYETCVGLGVRSVYVDNGRYEAGGSRTNRIEAEKVVDILYELLQTQPQNESIGIIALSRLQSDLIQDLIDLRRLSDRQYDERFTADVRERLFVKNLENVQGDERDHIILSIGYGPTVATGKTHNRFGPLNNEGGHRRLNVAVSRARKSMTVVHSLRAMDITSETQGARLLRCYLEYASKGEASIEGEILPGDETEPESPFEDAVGRALIQRGYRIQRQVGCAKYSIDIVILSEYGNNYELAIECDGKTYHSSPSARDRDRLRQEILENLGWRGRIHRIWSTSWIRNPEAEIRAIERALHKARLLPEESDRDTMSKISKKQEYTNIMNQDNEVDDRIIVPGKSNNIFTPYYIADLSKYSKDEDLREMPSNRMSELVTDIVRAEEPVHIDIVIERARRHTNLQRAGSRVREAIMKGMRIALRQNIIKRLPNTINKETNSKYLVIRYGISYEPRGAQIDGIVRDIDYICDQELEAGIYVIVRSMAGAKIDEIIVTTSRAFGYARKGQNVEDKISKAIIRMINNSILIERVGSLVINE